MEILSSSSGNVSFLTLIGQLWRKEDFIALEATVDEVCTQEQSVIVMNVHRLSLINNQGLDLLAKCYVKVKEAGAQFILFSPVETISEMLESSGIDIFMTIISSKEELDKTLKLLIQA